MYEKTIILCLTMQRYDKKPIREKNINESALLFSKTGYLYFVSSLFRPIIGTDGLFIYPILLAGTFRNKRWHACDVALIIAFGALRSARIHKSNVSDVLNCCRDIQLDKTASTTIPALKCERPVINNLYTFRQDNLFKTCTCKRTFPNLFQS